MFFLIKAFEIFFRKASEELHKRSSNSKRSPKLSSELKNVANLARTHRQSNFGCFVFPRPAIDSNIFFFLITQRNLRQWFGAFVWISLYGTKLQFHQTIIMVNNIPPRMRGGEILPCHAKMAFLFIILCFSHDLFFSVLIQLQSCLPLCDVKSISGVQTGVNRSIEFEGWEKINSQHIFHFRMVK